MGEPRDLFDLLGDGSLLAICPDGDPLLDELRARAARLEHIAPTARSIELPAARFDAAYVAGTLEHLERDAGRALLARLRDVHAGRVVVAVPMGGAAGWTESDLLGLGFVHVGGTATEGPRVAFWGFDIATYKLTPDWLNARFWAHPELFDRYWW